MKVVGANIDFLYRFFYLIFRSSRPQRSNGTPRSIGTKCKLASLSAIEIAATEMIFALLTRLS